MKALFIGGTGTISTAISALCVQRGWELYLLNRGNHPDRMPEGSHSIPADMADEAAVQAALQGKTFDVVADFIAYTPDQGSGISACLKAGRGSTSLSAPRRRTRNR